MLNARTHYAAAASLRDHAGVLTLVLLLHAGLGSAWIMQTQPAGQAASEMYVSLAVAQNAAPLPRSTPPAQARPPAAPENTLAQPLPDMPETVPQPQTIAAPPAESAAPAPGAVSEPDYRASYLNNRLPSYPLAARRMGYRGKVLLNVEVLAEGAAGQILLYASSGHDVLDNAALAAVKGWHFAPARQAGRAVTKWFIVPINFSLEG